MAGVNTGRVIPVGRSSDGKFNELTCTLPVAATQTLTSDNTNNAAGETVTISGPLGTWVYVFRAAITATTAERQVLIGADADGSLTNLANEANNGRNAQPYGTFGTVSSHILTFTANAEFTGLLGNTIGTTTTAAHLTWGSTTLTGGTSAILNVTPGASSTTTAATLSQANKTVAATGTPEAIGSGLVESITIKALKGRTTANTGNVFIGFSSTNDSQLYTLAPGEVLSLTAPDGKKINLAGIYIDVATNGDGVIYTAVA